MTQFSWKQTRQHYFRPKQRKVYTNLGLTLAALSIFGAFAIRPTVATIFELRKKLKEQEEVCERLDTKLSNLSLAQTELRRIKSDLPVIEQYLPYGEDYPHLLEEVHHTSEANDLRLEYTFFQDVKDTEIETTNQALKLKIIPFQLRSEGTFSNFLGFLTKFQETPRSINPHEIRIDNQQQGGNETYDLKANAYFYTDE